MFGQGRGFPFGLSIMTFCHSLGEICDAAVMTYGNVVGVLIAK